MLLRSGKVTMAAQTQQQDRQNLTCPCGKTFKLPAALTAHKKAKCCQSAKTTHLPSYASSKQSATLPSRKLLCSCGKSFKTPDALSAHEQAKHPPQTTRRLLGNVFNATLKNGSSMPIPGPALSHGPSLCCGYCGKTFNSAPDLQNHIKGKHGVTVTPQTNQLDCPYCSKIGFKAAEDLQQHIRAKHPRVSNANTAKVSAAPQRLDCSLCLAVDFKTTEQLRHHMDDNHPSCTKCKVRFGDGYNRRGIFRTGEEQLIDHQAEEGHVPIGSAVISKQLPYVSDAHVSVTDPTSHATEKSAGDNVEDTQPQHHLAPPHLRMTNAQAKSKSEQNLVTTTVTHSLPLARPMRIGKRVMEPTKRMELRKHVDVSEWLATATESNSTHSDSWSDVADENSIYEAPNADGGVVLDGNPPPLTAPHHESPPSSAGSHDESPPYSVVAPTDTPMACHFCPDDAFDSPEELGRHVNAQHPSCPQCMTVFHGERRANNEEWARSALEQLLEHCRVSRHCYCVEHDMVFVSVQDLEVHVLHSHIPRCECAQCGRNCTDADDLKKHMSAERHSVPSRAMEKGVNDETGLDSSDRASCDVEDNGSHDEMSEDGGISLG